VTDTECDTVMDLDGYSYYADFSRTSHSMLEVFIESPLLYHKRFVTKSLRDDADDDSRTLGSALHDWLDHKKVLIAPRMDRRTKAGKEAWAELKGSGDEAIILSQAQGNVFMAMQRGVLGNKDASRLLELTNDSREVVIHFTYRNGLPCKAKVDRLLEGQAAIDLKTTTDPRPGPFHRHARRLGYYRQADWYMKAAGVPKFFFIAQRNRQPYDCWVYRVASAELELAGAENDAFTDELRTCLEFDYWTGRSDGIHSLGEVTDDLFGISEDDPGRTGIASDVR